MKWISVKDRLPTMAEEVFDGNEILVFHNGRIHPGTSSFETMVCTYAGCHGAYNESSEKGKVTHWIVIKPPAEDNE
jgi:hypothetical protein